MDAPTSGERITGIEPVPLDGNHDSTPFGFKVKNRKGPTSRQQIEEQEKAEMEIRVATMAEIAIAKGLRRLRVGDMEIELFAPPPPPAIQYDLVAKTASSTSPLKAVREALACGCGHHAVSDHSPAGCLHGCSPEICNKSYDEAADKSREKDEKSNG